MTTLPLSVVGFFQIGLLFIVILLLTLIIWFNVNMQSAMNAVSMKNRKMDGGMVWLILVPVLNIVWPFIFNNALRTSYKAEFIQKGIPSPVNLVSGLIYPGFQVLSIIIYYIGFALIATLSYGYNDVAAISSITLVLVLLLYLVNVVIWIAFWVNVNGLKTILVRHDQIGIYDMPLTQQAVYSQPETPTFKPPFSQPISSDISNPVSENSASSLEIKTPEPVKQASVIDKLKKYHEMLAEGLITEVDFDRIKNELLNQK